MKLIYIRSTMEPKNYSTIRSILKKEQGEKIAPYIFKINDTQTLEAYLKKERITYEIYQEERKIINIKKRKQDEDVQLRCSATKPYKVNFHVRRNYGVLKSHIMQTQKNVSFNTSRSFAQFIFKIIVTPTT